MGDLREETSQIESVSGGPNAKSSLLPLMPKVDLA